jgi:hypothetical protein
MRWVRIVVRMKEMNMKLLSGKPKEKRTDGRLRSRWEDNIKMGPREIEWEVADWIHLAQGMASGVLL